MPIRKSFVDHLRSHFPELGRVDLESIVSDNLVSPFEIELSSTVLKEAQSFVSTAYRMRSSASYLANYSDRLSQLGISDPGNKGVMMSYDFHVNADGKLKLIEINTNAAFLALGLEMYKHAGCTLPISDFSYLDLRACIEEELKLNGKVPRHPLTLAIIDENPEQQRLYVEFLLYQNIFNSFGWQCQILDFQSDLSKFDFVYNRYTDFYLQDPRSRNLRQAFLEKQFCLSPNPYEYFLLADKERLVDWSQPGFLERMGLTPPELATIRSGLTTSQVINAETSERIWSERKKLFFKPMRAFGSKQSYRGATVSRKAFEALANGETLAQEFVPAPEVIFTTPTGPESFKYDLRFYAYQDRVQMVVARIYQGQVTNLKAAYGGFACVKFN